MRAIICGSRLNQQREHVFARLDVFHAQSPISFVIEGGQRTRDKKTRQIIGGVDFFAREWARARKIPFATVNAHWTKYGKGAGPIRNLEMIVAHHPDVIVAFPGGSGTANMVRQATEHGIRVVRLA